MERISSLQALHAHFTRTGAGAALADRIQEKQDDERLVAHIERAQAMMQAIGSKRPMRPPMRPMGGFIPDKPSTDMLAHMASPELVEGDGRQALAVEVEDVLGYTPLRKDAGAPSRLQRLLRELEIEAFDLATVDAYKLKMQQHFQAKADSQISHLVSQANEAWRSSIRYLTGFLWKRVVLSDYSKPVPEFVLRKCLEIKKHAPDAVFLVDELVEERRTFDPFMVVQLGQDQAYIEVWDEPEFEKAL